MSYAPHIWFNDFWLLRDYLVSGRRWGRCGAWPIATAPGRWPRSPRIGCRRALPTPPARAMRARARPRQAQVPMNASVGEVTLHLELSSVPAWKFMILNQVRGGGWV